MGWLLWEARLAAIGAPTEIANANLSQKSV